MCRDLELTRVYGPWGSALSQELTEEQQERKLTSGHTWQSSHPCEPPTNINPDLTFFSSLFCLHGPSRVSHSKIPSVNHLHRIALLSISFQISQQDSGDVALSLLGAPTLPCRAFSNHIQDPRHSELGTLASSVRLAAF